MNLTKLRLLTPSFLTKVVGAVLSIRDSPTFNRQSGTTKTSTKAIGKFSILVYCSRTSGVLAAF